MFHFSPVDKPKKHPNPFDVWTAPEHDRMTKDRRRDWQRDDWGHPMRDKPRVLVLDPRPTIMLPEKKPNVLLSPAFDGEVDSNWGFRSP